MLTDFLQNVQFKLQEEQAKRDAPPSRVWSTPYKWFINPVLQCPYCEEWLETKRVWIVDEEEFKVVAVFKVAGGKSLNVTFCHPHVGQAGKICKGSAHTPAEALFHGLSDDAYTKPYEWLPEVLGHQCAEMGEGEDENYFVCDGCGDRYHIDENYYSEDTDGRYCRDCYWEVHWRCEACDGEWHVESSECSSVVNNRTYCESCFSQYFFNCEDCCGDFSHGDYGGDGRCQECYDELWDRCSQCGEDSLRTDEALDQNGLCEDCRPPAEEEEEEEDDDE